MLFLLFCIQGTWVKRALTDGKSNNRFFTSFLLNCSNGLKYYFKKNKKIYYVASVLTEDKKGLQQNLNVQLL